MRKANKIFARSMAAVLSLTALLGATACGGGGGDGEDDGPELLIKMANFGGGIGDAWLTQAFDRFKADKMTNEYTTGDGETKVGLKLDLRSDTGVHIPNLNTQTEHIFLVQEKFTRNFTEIQKGNVVDITDIVTSPLTEYSEDRSIEDKLDEDYRFAMKGNDGNYYMLPHYEYISGASYDYELFKDKGWFLAKTSEGTDDFTTGLLPGKTFYFTSDPAKMTVGNDGKAGTDDDGMPTTLDELVAQCARIKDDDIAAFSVAGNHIDYFNHFVESLWTALAGYEQRNAVVSQTGTVDYVTGVSTTELWPGTGIMKPETTSVTLAGPDSDAFCKDGYKAIDQKGRYYAFAFVELAYKEGWIHDGYKTSSFNHQKAMEDFVLNGLRGKEKIASHIEASYWYNECENYGYFNDYKTIAKKDFKDIRHWHMPTAYENGEVVTSETNKRAEALMNACTATIMINKTSTNGEADVLKVCKDFLRFLSTEQELKNFTACTGAAKALYDYSIDESVLGNLDPYQQSIMSMRANTTQNPVVNQYGNNNVARYQSDYVTYSANCSGYKVDTTGFTTDASAYLSILQAYHETDKEGKTYLNAYKCFQYTGFNADTWMTKVYNNAFAD